MTGTMRALLLGLCVAGFALAPLQARAAGAHLPRQLVVYDRMSTWGSAAATCSPAGTDQRTVPGSFPYVCVSVQFSLWRGYHRGRITLTSPHSLNTTWSSFNGKTNHPILHAFSTQTVDLAGTWRVSLRVDGGDIARKTFAVVGPGPAPDRSAPGAPDVTVSPAAAPPGYAVTDLNNVYEMTDIMYGARLDLSRFTLTRDPADRQYVLSFYARATKVPSRNDATAPTWQPGDSVLRLIGSTLHPYGFYSTFCSAGPAFRPRELRNGQSTEGWMCSEGIPTSSMIGSYTLTWTGAGYTPAPVLNIHLSA